MASYQACQLKRGIVIMSSPACFFADAVTIVLLYLTYLTVR